MIDPLELKGNDLKITYPSLTKAFKSGYNIQVNLFALINKPGKVIDIEELSETDLFIFTLQFNDGNTFEIPYHPELFEKV